MFPVTADFACCYLNATLFQVVFVRKLLVLIVSILFPPVTSMTTRAQCLAFIVLVSLVLHCAIFYVPAVDCCIFYQWFPDLRFYSWSSWSELLVIRWAPLASARTCYSRWGALLKSNCWTHQCQCSMWLHVYLTARSLDLSLALLTSRSLLLSDSLTLTLTRISLLVVHSCITDLTLLGQLRRTLWTSWHKRSPWCRFFWRRTCTHHVNVLAWIAIELARLDSCWLVTDWLLLLCRLAVTHST